MDFLDLCNASSDLSEEEKAAELLPIHVQQCYVLSRLGNLEGAEAVASSISPKESAIPVPFRLLTDIS